MSSADAVAIVLWIGATCTPSSVAPTSGPACGACSPARATRRAAARADRLGDRAGLGGQPRVADLHARRALDGVPARVRGDLLDPVHPAQPRRPGNRPARVRVRVPQRPRGSPAAGDSGRVRAGVGADALLPGHRVGAIAGGRVPVGNATGDAVTSWLNPLSLVIGALFVATGAYLSAVFLVSDARRAERARPRALLQRSRAGRRRRHGALAAAGLVRCTATRGTSSTASPATGCRS